MSQLPQPNENRDILEQARITLLARHRELLVSRVNAVQGGNPETADDYQYAAEQVANACDHLTLTQDALPGRSR